MRELILPGFCITEANSRKHNTHPQLILQRLGGGENVGVTCNKETASTRKPTVIVLFCDVDMCPSEILLI